MFERTDKQVTSVQINNNNKKKTAAGDFCANLPLLLLEICLKFELL